MDHADRPRPVRKPRRVVRAATDGVPENERDTSDEPSDVDEQSPGGSTPTVGVPDDWWREQRPPHWG